MRVAVTGGRDYTDRQRVAEALATLHQASPITLIIHDTADTLSAAWAASEGIAAEEHPVDDIEMLTTGEPDLLVVFPGGRGTEHCHREALRRGIPTLEVHE